MNIHRSRIAIAVFALALLALSACKKEEAAPVVEAAPLTAPASTSDNTAWKAYLADVIKRNSGSVTGQTYAYYLPGEGTPDFDAEYGRLLQKAKEDAGRGIIEGNLLAYGSPASAKMADLVVGAFDGAEPGTMKGVKLLFIGNAADSERVKAAVAPAGVDYVFIEAK